jgi:hypothetical protein
MEQGASNYFDAKNNQDVNEKRPLASKTPEEIAKETDEKLIDSGFFREINADGSCNLLLLDDLKLTEDKEDFTPESYKNAKRFFIPKEYVLDYNSIEFYVNKMLSKQENTNGTDNAN